MKQMMIATFCFIFLATLAFSVQALYINGFQAQQYSHGDMIWTGRVIPGGSEVTLYGDADQLRAQISRLNPSYHTNTRNLSTALDTRLIHDRDDHDLAKLFCGGFSTGDRRGVESHAKDHLANLGGNCGAAPGECARMTCKDTTASYVCNDGPTHLEVPCSTLADFLDFILGNCCDCSRDDGPHYAMSGQLFSPGGTFNVIAGYGNCNHPADVRPGSYNPPGPNGNCLMCEAPPPQPDPVPDPTPTTTVIEIAPPPVTSTSTSTTPPPDPETTWAPLPEIETTTSTTPTPDPEPTWVAPVPSDTHAREESSPDPTPTTVEGEDGNMPLPTLSTERPPRQSDPGSDVESDEENGGNKDEGGGLTKEAQIGIGVGVPSVVLTALSLYVMCVRRS